MPGRTILKWSLIVLSTLAVTWIANAPIASEWSRVGIVDAEVPAFSQERAAALRSEIFDGLVGRFAAEGIQAWWRLDDAVVTFGYLIDGGACDCRVELRFPGDGLAPWSRLDGRDERWVPLWPNDAVRRRAVVRLRAVEQAHSSALAGLP